MHGCKVVAKQHQHSIHSFLLSILERQTGLEPATSTLARWRTTNCTTVASYSPTSNRRRKLSYHSYFQKARFFPKVFPRSAKRFFEKESAHLFQRTAAAGYPLGLAPDFGGETALHGTSVHSKIRKERRRLCELERAYKIEFDSAQGGELFMTSCGCSRTER